MTNEMKLFEQSGQELPAYLRKMEVDAVTRSLAGAGGRRISIRGSVFRLIYGGNETAQRDERWMNVVVINAADKIGRQWYKERYDAENVGPPDCWSADGVLPDASVEHKPSLNCADCPNNIKGSGEKEDTKACRYMQRLAVLLENDLRGDVYQMVLPATSIFGKGEADKMPLQAYARFLAGFNVPITAVLTQMRFDTASESPKLLFKAVRPLTEEEFNTGRVKAQTPEAMQAITYTVAQTDGVKKKEQPLETEPEPGAHANGASNGAAMAKSVITASLSTAEPDVEPEVVKHTKETPVKKRDVSTILKEWDKE